MEQKSDPELELESLYAKFEDAIDKNDKKIIQDLRPLLREKDSNYYLKTPELAIKHDNPDMYIFIMELLRLSIEHNARDHLFDSIRDGREKMIRLLVPMIDDLNNNLLEDRDEDGDLFDIQGTNPIAVALKNYDAKIFDFLIENGAVPSDDDFREAGRIGNTDLLLPLIKNLDTYENYVNYMTSAFENALTYNNIDFANYIIDYDNEHTNDEKKNMYEISSNVLTYAVRKENLQLVEKILSNRHIGEHIIANALAVSTDLTQKDLSRKVESNDKFRIMARIKEDPRSGPFTVKHLRGAIGVKNIDIINYILNHSKDLPLQEPEMLRFIFEGSYRYSIPYQDDVSLVLLRWFARHKNPEVRALPFKYNKIRKNLLPLVYSLTELENYQMQGIYQAPPNYHQYEYKEAHVGPSGHYTYDWKAYVEIYLLNRNDREIEELNNLFGIDFNEIRNSPLMAGILSIVSSYLGY